MSARWLPPDHPYPLSVDLPRSHHLRPIRAEDVEIDYPAVMGSREILWRKYGEDWGWPSADMTLEDDRTDLVRHVREMEARESFNYAILDEAESQLRGCVYIHPPYRPADAGFDAVVAHRRRRCGAGGHARRLPPRWLASDWPFGRVRQSP